MFGTVPAFFAILALAAGGESLPAFGERCIPSRLGATADFHHGLLGEPESPAPAAFKVRLETTKGDVVIEVQRAFSPHAADRFFNLVKAGYYDDTRITRVVPPKWAQFGINGNPGVARAWRDRTIPDEPRVLPNERGTIAFAFAVPNGRSTQVFINLRDNRETHDREPFVPFGRVILGMDVVDAWYAGYGENAGSGIRSGKQAPIFEGGNAYLDREYPKLDSIRRAVLIPEDR